MKYALYKIGCMPNPDIDMEKTHKMLLDICGNMEEGITKNLALVGLQLKGFSVYTPKTYNYDVDTLDIDIEIIDKNKLINYIRRNTEELNRLYTKNKSYDGYIALTPSDTDKAICIIQSKNELDCIILRELLKEYKFKEIVADSIEYIEEED